MSSSAAAVVVVEDVSGLVWSGLHSDWLMLWFLQCESSEKFTFIPPKKGLACSLCRVIFTFRVKILVCIFLCTLVIISVTIFFPQGKNLL